MRRRLGSRGNDVQTSRRSSDLGGETVRAAPDVGMCGATSARIFLGLKWPHGRPELSRAPACAAAHWRCRALASPRRAHRGRGSPQRRRPPAAPACGPAEVSTSPRRVEVAAREEAPQPGAAEGVQEGPEEPAPPRGPDRHSAGGSGGLWGCEEAADAPAAVVGGPQGREAHAGSFGAPAELAYVVWRAQRGPHRHQRRGEALGRASTGASRAGPTLARAGRAFGAFRPPLSRLARTRLRPPAMGLRCRPAASTCDAA